MVHLFLFTLLDKSLFTILKSEYLKSKSALVLKLLIVVWVSEKNSDN